MQKQIGNTTIELIEGDVTTMDTDAIVQAVPNEQVAAQIYTASLMAINVDTDAEKRYMQELASKLGLNRQVMAYLHQAIGMA